MSSPNREVDSRYYDESDYYDDRVQSYAELLASPFQRYRVAKVLELYTPNKDERVVDLGCALGTFCFALAPHCREVTGVDYSRKAIAVCTRLLETSPYGNIRFVCADGQHTGLGTGEYDVVVCADLFEHLYPEPAQGVLDECRRMLRKSGKLLIWTPHRGHFFEILKNRNILFRKDTSHVDYKSMRLLLGSLRERNFRILKAYYAESHNPVLRDLERAFLSVLPMLRRRIAILAEKGE